MLIDKAENKYCYDPTFYDFGQLIKSAYADTNSMIGELTFGQWSWPQIPGDNVINACQIIA